MTDGYLNFDTKINTSGFTSGLKKLAGALAIGATVKSAVKAGMSFESAFAGVRKTVDATAEQLEGLKQGIRDMAKELPTSANEIAGVAEAAGQLGIETDNILGFTKTMTMLGDATNLTAEQAATTLARFANITGMSQDNFDRLGSSVVALGNNFATTEAEIADMAQNIASAGSQVGMSEPEIMGFAAALSSVGMEAAAGGTAISKLVKDMQLAVEKGGKDLQQFANVAGVSANEFSKAFRDNAANAVTKFFTGLNDTERLGKSAIAVLDDMGISEVRLSDAILRAAGSGDLFQKALETSKKAWEDNTALTKEAEQRYETLESQLGILKNHLIDLGISFYDGIQEPLKKAVSSAIDSLSSLTKSIQNGSLQDAVAGIGESFGAITGTIANLASIVLPPLISILGALGKQLDIIGPTVISAIAAFKGFNAINSTIEAIPSLIAAISSPVGMVTVAIAGLTAGFLAFEKIMTTGLDEQEAFAEQCKETRDAISEQKDAYEEYKKVQAREVNANLAEIENSKQLTNELASLVDAEGKVNEANQGRASFILNELSKAYGVEYSLVDGAIQNRNGEKVAIDEIKNAIYSLIEAKRLEALMGSSKNAYDESFEREAETLDTLKEAYNELTTQQQNYKQSLERSHGSLQIEDASIEGLTAKVNELSTAKEKLQSKNEELTPEELLQVSAYDSQVVAINNAIDSLQSYQDAYDSANSNYVNLLNDRNLYEQAYSLQAQGRTEEAIELLESANSSYVNAEAAVKHYGKGSEEALNAFATNAQTDLLKLKTAMDVYVADPSESAQQTLKNSLESAQESMKAFSDAGGDYTKVFSDSVNGMDIDLSSLLTDVGTQLTDLAGDFEEGGENAIKGFENSLNSGDGALQAVTTLCESILNLFMRGLEEHSPSKATERNGVWLIEGLLNGITKSIESVFFAISNFCNTIKNNFSSFLSAETLLENGRNLISGIASGISSSAGHVISSATAFCSKAINTFSSYLNINTLFSAGSSTIQGLINGIKSMASAALSAISSVVSPLAETARNILKVNSPSKVFRDQVGKSIPEGLALGIENNAKMAVLAVGKMSKDTIFAAKKAIDSHSPSKVFENQVGKTIPQGVAVGIKENTYEVTDAVKQMFDDIKLQKELGSISEGEYYEKLREYRDQYLEESTKEWWDYTKELISYEEKLRDRQFKNLDWFHDNSIISDSLYYQMLADLRDQYFSESDEEWQDYTEKILNHQMDLINDTKDSLKDALEEAQNAFDDAVADGAEKMREFSPSLLKIKSDDGNGNITEYYRPNDYSYRKYSDEYYNSMMNMQGLIGMLEPGTEEYEAGLKIYAGLAAEDPQEAVKQIQTYLNMGLDDFINHIKQTTKIWREDDSRGADIYGFIPGLELEKAEDDMEQFEKEWLDAFGTLPDQSYNIGVDMMQSIINGALSQIENFKSQVVDGMLSVFSGASVGINASSASPAAASAGGGNTYIINSPGSTIGESIRALKNQDTINRLRGY